MLMEHIMSYQGHPDTTKTGALQIYVILVWQKKCDLTDWNKVKEAVCACIFPSQLLVNIMVDSQTVKQRI